MSWLREHWPHIFGSTVACIVGLPAGVASYRHGIEVVRTHSTDPAMADWLPMTTDGLLLAALVVMWARRMTGRRIGTGPWAAFLLGLTATLLTNLGAANITPWGIGVALWPPICLAIVLELVALVVTPDRAETGHQTVVPAGTVPAVPEAVVPAVPDVVPAVVTADVPDVVPADVPDTVPAPVPDTVPDRARSDLHGHGKHAADETDTEPTDGTDEEILAWLQEEAERARAVPGRRELQARWKCGATRADRLRGQVSVPARMRRVK